MYIEILKKNKQWYWRIVAKNNRILAVSETYSSLSKAKATVRSFIAGHIKGLVVVDIK